MNCKLEIYSSDFSTKLPLQYAEEGIRAGFPSPAQDYTTEPIDLNKELIRHPSSTFYARVVGDSMTGCGIDDGDLIVIDKYIEPHDGDIVVAFIDGEFTLKRIKTEEDYLLLMPENPEYTPIKVTETNRFIVWGVVTYNIKRQCNR